MPEDVAELKNEWIQRFTNMSLQEQEEILKLLAAFIENYSPLPEPPGENELSLKRSRRRTKFV